jgi:hypothetical protein
MPVQSPPSASPHALFDDQAEEAVAFYTSIFKNSRGPCPRPGMAALPAR